MDLVMYEYKKQDNGVVLFFMLEQLLNHIDLQWSFLEFEIKVLYGSLADERELDLFVFLYEFHEWDNNFPGHLVFVRRIAG